MTYLADATINIISRMAVIIHDNHSFWFPYRHWSDCTHKDCQKTLQDLQDLRDKAGAEKFRKDRPYTPNRVPRGAR